MQAIFWPRGRGPRAAACWQLAVFAVASHAAVFLTATASAQETSAHEQPLIVHGSGLNRENNAALMMAKAKQSGVLRVRVGLRSHNAGERGRNVNEAADVEMTKDLVASRVLGFARKGMAKTFKNVPVMSITVTPDELDRLASDADVEWVREAVTFAPSLEYTRHLIGADAVFAGAAKIPMDGTGQAVAVIDTGVDDTHPMLSGKVIKEAAACISGNFSGGQSHSLCPGGVTTVIGGDAARPCPLEACWHGTHVASIAAGAGPLNGIAKGAQIIPIMAAYNNRKMVSFDDDDLYQALLYVYSLRDTYKIAAVNLSIQGPMFVSSCDTSFPDYAAIIALLRDAGIATVVASGNMYMDDRIASPACLSNVISVAASTKGDRVSPFSNFTANVTLVAPGSDIHAAIPGGGYMHAWGTSMAAPHVAGAFAVLKEADPNASVEDIASALACSGKPLLREGNHIAKPRVDLVSARNAMKGHVFRRWKFETSDDSAEWATIGGKWVARNGAYVGIPTQNGFVGTMLSSCNKTFVVRTVVKIEDGSATPATTSAGVMLDANIDYVHNKISGYWLNYLNGPQRTASIVRIDGVRLDGEPSGSVTSLCSSKVGSIRPGKANDIVAGVTDSGLVFYLNGQLVCEAKGTVSSNRIVVGARLEQANSDERVSIAMAQVTRRIPNAIIASNASEPDISQIAYTKRTIISVVRSMSEPDKRSRTSTESMYPL